MNKRGCDCHSYNGDFGKTPEVKLKMISSISPDGKVSHKDVMVDACIAKIIKYLWDKGVNTIGSCCGHGFGRPSIVLGEWQDNYEQIRRWIKEIDDRQFEITQWRRIIC